MLKKNYLSYIIIGDFMNNRDMFYQNLNQGYQMPGMIYPPSGYNLNQEYQAYGPNVIPYNNQMYNMNGNMNNNYNNTNNDLEDRVSKLERQIKTLDTRLQKLESVSNEINDNIYMI